MSSSGKMRLKIIRKPKQTAPSEKQMSETVNRGTGAGGAKTNHNGKKFEAKTDNLPRLLEQGFTKKVIPGATGKQSVYHEKQIDADTSIVYMTQTALKAYFTHFFHKEMVRQPDEAYLFRTGDTYKLCILEKKNQNTTGSVDQKLGVGQYLKEEYAECLDERFTIEYAFCLSSFLKKDYISSQKKYEIMRKLHAKDHITVLFGDDENYFTTLDTWLGFN